MNFYKRLMFFSSGFILGLILLSFFLTGKKTSCSYFPNDRVIKNINSKKISYSNGVEKDSVLIKSVLINGRVDFSKSKTKLDSCKTYYIENKIEEKIYMALVNNCENYISVENFKEIKLD